MRWVGCVQKSQKALRRSIGALWTHIVQQQQENMPPRGSINGAAMERTQNVQESPAAQWSCDGVNVQCKCHKIRKGKIGPVGQKHMEHQSPSSCTKAPSVNIK